MKKIAAAVLVLGLTAAAISQVRIPSAPQELLLALWSTCFVDKWIVVGDYALTCVAEKIKST